MFLMVYLHIALEMMQNGLRTSGIGCESMECVYGACCFISSTLWMRMMFLARIHLPQMWTANEFRSAFDVGEFEVNIFVVFQTHVHAFFNNNSN